MDRSIQTEDVPEAGSSNDPQHRTERIGTNGSKHKFAVEYKPTREPEEPSDEKDQTDQPNFDEQPQVEESQESAEDEKKDSTCPESSKWDTSSPSKFQSARKKFRSDNPIHWYGILVPPSLRNAQKSFTEGIEGQVPELAGTIVEMRALEQQITELRAKLGSSSPEVSNTPIQY